MYDFLLIIFVQWLHIGGFASDIPNEAIITEFKFLFNVWSKGKFEIAGYRVYADVFAPITDGFAPLNQTWKAGTITASFSISGEIPNQQRYATGADLKDAVSWCSFDSLQIK